MTDAADTPTSPLPTDTPPAGVPTPGLDSLAKSFEPLAIEAHWAPLWEHSG